ncbi:hypothetical protein BU15DRAFT_59221 [Melanogaster broomeanus]|nr:hypothetical protein BU15DRAFT_59221 [Melanogaster broomeanus]
MPDHDLQQSSTVNVSSAPGGTLVTGVILLPVISQTRWFNSSWSVADINTRLERELFATFTRTFALEKEPEYTTTRIHQLLNPNMRFNPSRTHFSDLTVDTTTQEFLVSFPLTSQDNFFGSLMTRHKEQIANLNADALISAEALKRPSEGKKKSKKKSDTKAVHDVPVQPPITMAGDPGPQMDFLGQLQSLSNTVNQLGARVQSLEDENTNLKTENATLRAQVVNLEADNADLRSKVVNLEAKVVNLEADNADLRSTVKAHERTLMAIRRRIVLDEARDKLEEKYQISLPFSVPLADFVHSLSTQLDSTDAANLPRRALWMIFASSPTTIRGSGNIAAHQASEEDLSNAILDVGLKREEQELLRGIYIFAHGSPPLF